MLLNIADLDTLLTRQTRRVFLLCFADVDALAALSILRDYFKTVHLCYGFSLLVFVSQLAAELEELSRTLSGPDATGVGDLLILLNVGADQDISEITRARVLLVDYHRPVHINNVFSSTVYVLDDGVVSGSLRACFQKNLASRMVQSSLQSGDPGMKRVLSGDPPAGDLEPGGAAGRHRRKRTGRRRHRRRMAPGRGRPGDAGPGEAIPAVNQGLVSHESEDDILSLSAVNLSDAGEGDTAGVSGRSSSEPAGRGSAAPPELVVSDLGSAEGSEASPALGGSGGAWPAADSRVAAEEPSGETIGSQDSTTGESDEYYYSEDDYSSSSAGETSRSSSRGSRHSRDLESPRSDREPSALSSRGDDQYTYEDYYTEISGGGDASDVGGPENLRDALDFSDSEGERQLQAMRDQLARDRAPRGLMLPGEAGPLDVSGAHLEPRASDSSGTDLDVSANLMSDHEDDGELRQLSFVVSGGPGEAGSESVSEGAGHRRVARMLAERDEQGGSKGIGGRGAGRRPGPTRVKKRRRVRKAQRWGEDGRIEARGASGRRSAGARRVKAESGWRAGKQERIASSLGAGSAGGRDGESVARQGLTPGLGAEFGGDEFLGEEDARILRHLRKYAPSSESLDSALSLRAIQSTLSPEDIRSLQSGLRALLESGDPASARKADSSIRKYADVICQSQPSAALLARYVLSFSSSIQPDNLYLREKVCWQGLLGVAWAISAQLARCEAFTSFWREYRGIIRSKPVRLRDDVSLTESAPLSVADSFVRSETQTPLGPGRAVSGAGHVPFMASPSLGGQSLSATGHRESPSSQTRSMSPRADGERGFRPLGRSQSGSSLAEVYNPRIFSSLASGPSLPGSLPAGRLGIQSVFRGADGSRVETGFALYDRGSPDVIRGIQIAPVARPRPYFVEIDPALFLFRLNSLSDALMSSSFSTVAALYRVHSLSSKEPRTILRGTLASTVITHMGVPNVIAQRSFTDLPKRKREVLISRYLTLVARAGAGRYSLATIPNVLVESSNERFEISVFDHAYLVDALICAMGANIHRLRVSPEAADAPERPRGPEEVEADPQSTQLRGLLTLAGASPEDLLLMLSPESGGRSRSVFVEALSHALEQQRVVIASEEKLRGKFQAQKAVPLLYSSTMDLPDTIFLSSLSLVSRILADCRSTVAWAKRLSLEHKYVSVEAEEIQGRALRAHASAQPAVPTQPAGQQSAPKTIFTDILGPAAFLPVFAKRTLPRERSFEEIRASLSVLLTVKGGETGVVASQSTRAGLVEGLFGNAIPGLRETLQSLEEGKRIPVLDEFRPEEVLIRRGECGAVGALMREKLSEKAHPAGWLGG